MKRSWCFFLYQIQYFITRFSSNINHILIFHIVYMLIQLNLNLINYQTYYLWSISGHKICSDADKIIEFNNNYGMYVVEENIEDLIYMFTDDARYYTLLSDPPRLGKQGTYHYHNAVCAVSSWQWRQCDLLVVVRIELERPVKCELTSLPIWNLGDSMVYLTIRYLWDVQMCVFFISNSCHKWLMGPGLTTAMQWWLVGIIVV